MSIPVALPDLARTVARYGFAYLLTTSSQGTPRVVAVHPVLKDGVFTVHGVGSGTRACVAARPQVTLVWPPSEHNTHSLICDGTAEVQDEVVHMVPTHAVLHRPAPAPVDPGSTVPTSGIEPV